MDAKDIVDFVEEIVSDLTGGPALITDDDDVLDELDIFPDEEETDPDYDDAGEDEEGEDEEPFEPSEDDPEEVPVTEEPDDYTEGVSDFTNEDTSDYVVFTKEDKESLDFLRGLFSNMDEGKLKALASDIENAATEGSIDLSTDSKKNEFLECIDSLAVDQEEIDELTDDMYNAIDTALTDSDSTILFLIPVNPNTIKRGFSGAFDEILSDEDLVSLNAVLDQAIGSVSSFNDNTVDDVVSYFTEHATMLDEEQLQTAAEIIEQAVYDRIDIETARADHIRSILLTTGIDQKCIQAANEVINEAVSRLYSAKGVADIADDIREALSEEDQTVVERVIDKFTELSGPFITSDNVEEVINGVRSALSDVSSDVLDAAESVIMDDVVSDEYPVNLSELKSNIVTTIIESKVADLMDEDEVETTKLIFKEAVGESLSLNDIDAKLGIFESLVAKTITTDQLYATRAAIREATIDTLYVKTLNAKLAVIEHAIIDELDARLADIDVANIDFANIDIAQVRQIFSEAGIINNLVVESGAITGELVGVTISGDLIEGNTIKANKLVVLGSDGLYYKLNVSGETVEAQQTDYNSINGTHIQAKTITASKINVTDLVAFGATIGGLILENGSIHSTGKTLNNNASGIYMDSQGQFNTGDATNFIASWYDTNENKWKVRIQSDLITFSNGQSVSQVVTGAVTTANEASAAVEDMQERMDSGEFKGETGPAGPTGPQGPKGEDGVSIASVTNYYLATDQSSGVSISTSGWTTAIQTITSAKPYLWNYEVSKDSDGNTISTTSPVIIGHYGQNGGTGPQGRSITGVTEYYCASASTTAPADSEFTTGVQTTTSTKKFLWNYEVISYSSGNPTTTAKRIIGTHGEKGDTPTVSKSGNTVTITGGNGSVTISDGSNPTVSKSGDTVTIVDGAGHTVTVKDGINGQSIKGDNAYLHIAWATNATGTEGFSTTDAAGKTYMGTYTDNTQADSTTSSDYDWVKIKGEKGATGPQGVSVTNVTSTNNTADGGTSVVTITLSDGTTKTFNVKNGNKGSTAQWYYGTLLTHTSGTATISTSSTSGVVVGSMYLNPAISLCYKCTDVSGTTATWTYAGDLTQGVIDNIEIGGRNILLNSSFADNLNEWEINSGTFDIVTIDGAKCGHATGTIQGTNYLRQNYLSKINASSRYDQVYTVSADIKLVNYIAGSTNPYVSLYMNGHYNNNGTTTWIGPTRVSGTLDSVSSNLIGLNNKGWTRVNLSFKYTRIVDLDVHCGIYMCDCTGDLYFKNLKLEIGDKATDWTPAPEDVQEDIIKASQSATKYITEFGDSGIKVHPENDTVNYAKIDATGMDVYQNNVSVAEFGADDNNVPISRIGPESDKNVLINSSGVNIRNASTTLANFAGTGASFSTSSSQNVVQISTGTTSNNQVGGRLSFTGSANDSAIIGYSKNGYSDLNLTVNTGIETGSTHLVHGITIRANSPSANKHSWVDLKPEDGVEIEADSSSAGSSIFMSNGGSISFGAYSFSPDKESNIFLEPSAITFTRPFTIEGHESAVGKDIAYTTTSVTSVSSPKTLGSISLSEGTWIIRAYVTFAGTSNANGYRRAAITTSEDTMPTQAFGLDYKYVEGDYIIVCNPIRIVTLSEPTTYYLNASSSKATTISNRSMRAIRLL